MPDPRKYRVLRSREQGGITAFRPFCAVFAQFLGLKAALRPLQGAHPSERQGGAWREPARIGTALSDPSR
jgi:hypothetical protein